MTKDNEGVEPEVEIDGQLPLIDLEETESDETESDEVEVEDEPVESKKAEKAAKPKKAPKPKVQKESVSGPPVLVTAGLGVLVIALAVAVFFVRGTAANAVDEDAVDKAVRTAASAAQHISSWDYKTLDTDVKQVLGESTGEFRAAYEKSATKLLASAPSQEAVVVGTVSKVGVESTKEGEVKVLVFLNQATTKKAADPSIAQHRLRLTMVEKNGEWLVAKLEML